ncbi:F-type H+-transporting ATPase subunit g, partial [Phenoliferia sp. Uapishka_3]
MSLLRTTLRAPLRQSVRQPTPRFASSTTEEAAAKAKEAAAKLQEAAGPALDKAKAVFGGVAEKAGGMLGAYKEPIVGNAAVAREVLKQVYVAEKLSPPSLAQVQQTYSSFFNSAKDLGYWRNLYESGQWKKFGIYAVEAYGIFKIGEMIGRRHIVGYKLDEVKPELAHA